MVSLLSIPGQPLSVKYPHSNAFCVLVMSFDGSRFTFVNLLYHFLSIVCILTTIACYSIIFYTTTKSGRKSGRTIFNYKLLFWTSLTLLSQTLCFIPPFIFTSGISFKLIHMNHKLKVFLITAVYPLNATLDPFLYARITDGFRVFFNVMMRHVKHG